MRFHSSADSEQFLVVTWLWLCRQGDVYWLSREECRGPLFSLEVMSNSLQPHTISSCCPLLLLPSVFPSIRVSPNESSLHIKWPKYWKLRLQHQSFQWMFRVDFL